MLPDYANNDSVSPYSTLLMAAMESGNPQLSFVDYVGFPGRFCTDYCSIQTRIGVMSPWLGSEPMKATKDPRNPWVKEGLPAHVPHVKVRRTGVLVFCMTHPRSGRAVLACLDEAEGVVCLLAK
jgi:hypothetical protein